MRYYRESNVKKTVFSALLLCLIVFPAGLYAQIIDRPVATVNLIRPEMISVKQLNSRIELINTQRRAQGLGPLTADEKKELLKTMITEVLIRQAAEKDKIVVTDAEINTAIQKYKKAAELQLGVTLTDKQFADLVLSQTGFAWEEYVKQLRIQITQQKYITQKKQNLFASVPVPSDAEIETFYRENATQFTNPEIVRFSHIYIDTRTLSNQDKPKALQRAEEANREARNSARPFDQLVAQYSDDVSSRYNGGDFGFLARNDQRAIAILGKPFFDAVFSLPVNTVKGVLESNIGYHIVKITAHYDPKILKIDDPVDPASDMTVREYIRSGLMQKNQEAAFVKAVEEITNELFDIGNVVMYEENIQ